MSRSDGIERWLRTTVGASPPGRYARLRSTAAVAALVRRERAIPFWPIERIEALQRQRIREVLQYAATAVPYYRDLLHARGQAPAAFDSAAALGRLPLIDGGDLALDPMRFVADGFRQRGREVFKTSGSSSGLRKPIFWDHASLLLRAARGERDRVVIARLAGESWTQVIVREFLTTEPRHVLARMLGVDTADHQRLLILPSDFSSRTQRTIVGEHSLIPRRPVHYHHLPPTVPLHAAAAHFAALRPRVVFSFGSWADQFFHYLHATGTRVPLPRVWVYLGDRISPGGRALAEDMGCALYSVYGAMEAGTIGFQCEERGGFHLNVDLCAVRIVGDDGVELPPGATGNVVISPLDNRAMVLLNYRLGDRGALSPERCACGRTLPLLARMEGRRSELLRLADGRELSSLTVESSFAGELRSTLCAQIEELAPGCLRWRIVPAATSDRGDVRAALLRRAALVFGAGTHVDVEFVDHIPLTAAGKFARTVVAARAGAAAPAPMPAPAAAPAPAAR
jgi:phenylacetate-CoA ligase